MKEKLIKCKLYFDKDKEEQWLNEMADKGWNMKKSCLGIYIFEHSDKRQYTYRIDILPEDEQEKEEYLTFLKEEGDIEIVQQRLFWVVLRKLSDKGVFELYSDAESKKQQYRKMEQIFYVLSGVCFFFMFFTAIPAVKKDHALIILPMFLAVLGVIMLKQARKNSQKRKKLGQCAADLF